MPFNFVVSYFKCTFTHNQILKNKMEDCENCNGTGTVDVLSCNSSAQDCCGGCTKEYECNECNGTGEILI